MSQDGDDRMLEELRAALAPEEQQPSALDISALRRAVAAQFSPSGGRPGHRIHRSWRPLRALAVAAILTFTGTAVAVSTGMPLPSVRSLARAVGLPVDSPALAGAKSAVRKLRAAMTQRDAEAVRSAAADLRERCSALDAAEHSLIAAELQALLRESEAFLAAHAALANKPPPRKRAPSSASPTAGDEGDKQDDSDDDLAGDSAEPEPQDVDSDDAEDGITETPKPSPRAEDPHDDPRDDRPGDDDDDDDDDDDTDDGEHDESL